MHGILKQELQQYDRFLFLYYCINYQFAELGRLKLLYFKIMLKEFLPCIQLYRKSVRDNADWHYGQKEFGVYSLRFTVVTNKKRERVNTFVCAVSLYVTKTSKASIKDQELPLLIIPFGIVAYGFVGQPFSKQLYTYHTTQRINSFEPQWWIQTLS